MRTLSIALAFSLACACVGCGAGSASGARTTNQSSQLASTSRASAAVASRTLPTVKVSPAVAREYPAIKKSALALLTTVLAHYQLSFKNGVWTDAGNSGCWACTDGGPMTGAAAAYVVGGAHNKKLLAEAIQSANTAIRTVQQANGSFVDPTVAGESVPITTAFYGVQLGMTDFLLRPYLDAATRQRWANALSSATMFLVNDGSTVWYANGNINLAYTELAWSAWNATGSQALKQIFNDSWNFTISPSSAKWPGFGLIITKAPTFADGSNGSGYLAESNGTDAPGWDPCYSMTQLDVLAPLYVMSHDSRVLRVMNLEFNQERTRVNPNTWVLNCADGTRHTDAVDNEAFQSSSIAALSMLGGRVGLLNEVSPELAAERRWFTTSLGAGKSKQYLSDSMLYRRTFGNDIATIALAAEEDQLSANRK